MKTKFQTVCNIVFLFLLLISCTTKDTNKKVSDTSSVLQEMVSDQIAVNYSKDTLTIHVDSLHLENNDEYLIFLLNTDCSFCIGQFLNFIAYYNKKDVHMPLIAIIEEGSTEIIKYHMKQTKLEENTKDLTFVENHNKEIISAPLELYSGMVFYCKNRKLAGSVLVKI